MARSRAPDRAPVPGTGLVAADHRLRCSSGVNLPLVSALVHREVSGWGARSGIYLASTAGSAGRLSVGRLRRTAGAGRIAALSETNLDLQGGLRVTRRSACWRSMRATLSGPRCAGTRGDRGEAFGNTQADRGAEVLGPAGIGALLRGLERGLAADLLRQGELGEALRLNPETRGAGICCGGLETRP